MQDFIERPSLPPLGGSRPAALVAALIVSAALSACSQTVDFLPSPAAPEAEAEATVRHDEAGGTHVSVVARSLPRPEKLEPPRLHYVVWAQTLDGRLAVLGRMRPDRQGRAQFTGSTGWDQFRILVSAEDLLSPRKPSAEIVLRTEVFDVR
jgi:hypothetical protein